MTRDDQLLTFPQQPGRGRTYAVMAGVAATMLTLAVGLPFALGNTPARNAGGTQVLSQDALKPGAPLPSSAASKSASAAAGASLPPGLALPGRTSAPLVPGFGGPAPAAGPKSTGQASGTSGTSGGALGGTAAQPGVKRTASEVGITPDTITLGYSSSTSAGRTRPGRASPVTTPPPSRATSTPTPTTSTPTAGSAAGGCSSNPRRSTS